MPSPAALRRAARIAVPGLLCAIAFVAAAQPAVAFEIFGFKFFEKEDEIDADIVDPLRYAPTVQVAGEDPDVTTAINDTSALIADQERPVSGSLGLLTKARGDRERLVAALYERARYDGVVDILIENQSIDALPPDTEFNQRPVPVLIDVDPGALYVLGDVRLEGDAAGLAPEQFGLVPGGDASSLKILKAEKEIVRKLKEGGRPLAMLGGRQIVADHPTATLDVTLSVKAGPIAGYGDTTVDGVNTMDPEFTAYMTGLPRGQTYSPQEIDDARDRLLALGVFNSVAVTPGNALDADGNIPINVAVTERKTRFFGAGASFSNTEGIGLEGYWGHRNLFGHAEKLRFEGAISGIGSTMDVTQLDYNAAILFEKPGVIGPASKFTASLKSVFEHPDAYDRFSTRGAAGVTYDLSKTQSVSAEFALDFSRITDVFVDRKDYLVASTPFQYVFDNRDNKLNPTKGFRVLGYGEPAYDIQNGTTFIKVRGEASTYLAIDADARMVLAGRVAGGSILGAGVEDIPADRRFFAGGGGSIRGYAYQGVGPKDSDGVPIGGLSFAEASLEARFAVTETIGVVPFVDAGTASLSEFPEFDEIKVGAGVGLRYLTPFGPLRVDVAMPLNKDPDDPDYGIYAGIGQAF